MIVGCTGHQALSPWTQDVVQLAFARAIARHDPSTVVGLTNLAAGADQLFARAVVNAGARLHLIIPCINYETTFTTVEDRAAYENFLQTAQERILLPFAMPSEEAFMAGGRAVAERCDLLLAVWDGKPAGGLGGTADVVAYARTLGKPVEVIWPEGASRE